MASFRLLPQYRGVKVRPYMRFMDVILFGCFFAFGLFGVGIYAFFHLENYQALDRVTIGATLALLLGVAVLSVYLTWFLQEANPWFKKLERLKQLSTYLFEHGYIYEKKRKKGVKIVFPRVYLKQGKYDLEVAFKMAGGKFQEKFKKLGGELETTFFMDFMEVADDPKFKTYTMAYSAFLNRIKVPDVLWDRSKGIKLMDGFYWDFISDPHFLVAGGTGGGKTVFLRALVQCLAKVGVVDICDPKRSDFVTMADIPAFQGRVAFELAAIVEQFEKAVVIMYARYDFIRQEMQRLGHKDIQKFYDYGLEPYFFVCDEYNLLKARFTRKDFELEQRLDSAVTQLVLAGRQAGVNVIIALQKPAANDLSSKIQANMMMHVAVGRLDEYGYEAMFGRENRNKEFRYVKYIAGRRVYGRGYAGVSGEVAREFYSPLMTKGYSFFDEFEKIERRRNPFDPTENQEVSPDLASDDELSAFIDGVVADSQSGGDKSETETSPAASPIGEGQALADLAKKVGVTTSTVRSLIALIEKNGYQTFTRVNGKHALTLEEGLLLEDLLEQKAVFEGTWKELLALHFDIY